MKIKQPYLLALVTYSSAYKVPVSVFPHEVDILKVRFGEDSVLITDTPPPIKEAEFDTEEEYARLLEVHPGSEASPNPVREVFRNLAEFEAAFEEAPKRGRKSKDDVDGAAA